MANLVLQGEKVLHLYFPKNTINLLNQLPYNNTPLNDYYFFLRNGVIKYKGKMIIAKYIEVEFQDLYGLTTIIYTLYNNQSYTIDAVHTTTTNEVEIIGVIEDDSNGDMISEEDLERYFNNETLGTKVELTPCYILLTTLIEEKNKVFKFTDKTSGYEYINEFGELENVNVELFTGEFTTIQSMMNPVIQLQFPIDWVGNELYKKNIGTRYNYAYVSLFERFYFINDVVFHEDGLMDINLNEDVLFTYCLDLKNQKGYILRNENSYDSKLVDERYPLEDRRDNTIISLNGYRPTTNLINFEFDTEHFDNSYYRYVITTITNYQGSTNIDPPTGAPLPTIAPYQSGYENFICNQEKAMYTQVALFKDDTKSGFCASIIVYPFNLLPVTENDNNLYNVYFSDSPSYVIDNNANFTTTIADAYVKGYVSSGASFKYLVLEDFTYIGRVQKPFFANYEPYARYELFVPFVGWITISAIDLLGKRILVYYGIDISTGGGTAYVYNKSDNYIIHSSPCKLGVSLPISTSNKTELERERQNNVSNLTLGLISSGISLGIGAVTGNPLGIISGVLSGANAIKSFTNANNMMFERGQSTLASTETAFYSPLKVHLKVSSNLPLFDEYNEPNETALYYHMNGAPCKRYDSLSNYTGYTEVADMHYIPNNKPINSDEINEILTLANNGIIL